MSEQQTIENVYTDWLGNLVHEGDWVLYSSKSTNVGMNLGKVEFIGISNNGKTHMLQVRIVDLTVNRAWSKGRLVSLHEYNGAFRSVTKYFGMIPETQDMAWTN